MALDPEKLKALPFREIRHAYAAKDSILYALGVGLGLDPLDEDQLRFVDETKLLALPSLATVLAYPGSWMREMDSGITWQQVVHGEQSMQIHKPLAAAGEIIGLTRISEIVDKGAGKGALVSAEKSLKDAATGEPIATLTQVIFCRADGGFGGAPTGSRQPHVLPDRSPDVTVTVPTSPQSALIYRLSGDRNPLHSDPALARSAGFERPILHGLATYGAACFALQSALCGNDPHKVREMHVRFSAPVMPGEAIDIDIWRGERDGIASFRARVAARNATVLNNGLFIFEP